ncbi:MAG: hypothetical protein M5U26_08225 [Planctomycetota bacterium]|nr:hypothetical protein [Planctomycetota bacterium]
MSTLDRAFPTLPPLRPPGPPRMTGRELRLAIKVLEVQQAAVAWAAGFSETYLRQRMSHHQDKPLSEHLERCVKPVLRLEHDSKRQNLPAQLNDWLQDLLA